MSTKARPPDRRIGPHDIGGEAAGPVDTADHGMAFWEKQANAFRMAVVGNRIVKLDELRRASEDTGEQYGKLAYFELTTTAMRNVLMEKGLISESELEAKMSEVRSRFDLAGQAQADGKKTRR